MRETVIGKYIRLSQADRDLMKKESKTESESISYQRALIQNYIDSDPELKGCRQEDFTRLPNPEVNLPAQEVGEYITSVLTAALQLRDLKSQQENSDIINNAIRYIEKHYTDENISLNSVAQAINISANYLSALFSQKMEVSFVEYLTQKRMNRAKQLLQRTNMRSSEIAYEVGYRDPRYFSFVFRKTQGCTPRAFRAGETEGE